MFLFYISTAASRIEDGTVGIYDCNEFLTVHEQHTINRAWLGQTSCRVSNQVSYRSDLWAMSGEKRDWLMTGIFRRGSLSLGKCQVLPFKNQIFFTKLHHGDSGFDSSPLSLFVLWWHSWCTTPRILKNTGSFSFLFVSHLPCFLRSWKLDDCAFVSWPYF